MVLAIHLSTRGLAFVLFEGPLSPYDWGVYEVRGAQRNARCLHRFERILTFYAPDVLVTQDMTSDGTRRTDRIRKLNALITEVADPRGIPIYAYTRAQIRQCFSVSSFPSKQAIAQVIVRHVPAFERYLPPPRKPWMAEDARMGLFDAAALAFAYFHHAGGEQHAA